MSAHELAPLDTPVWPRAEPATITMIRAELGQRRPFGQPTADLADRLDLLAEACDPGTAMLAVLWLAGERRSSRLTRRSYIDDLLQWSLWLKLHRDGRRLELVSLSRTDVTLWVHHERSAERCADCGKTASRAPATIARRLNALSSIYRYGVGHGLPLVCPINLDDHRPKVPTGRRETSARVLTREEIDRMFRACYDTRDALVVALLFTGGMRVSEMTDTTVKDIVTDGRRSYLRVTRKGGNKVRIPLDPAVCDLLDTYATERPAWSGRGAAPLLADAAGAQLDRNDVARMLARLARAAHIPDPKTVTPHSIRASAITYHIERGRPLTEVQAFAGHSDVRVTMGYYERHGADERNAAMVADAAPLVIQSPAWKASTGDAS